MYIYISNPIYNLILDKWTVETKEEKGEKNVFFFDDYVKADKFANKLAINNKKRSK